MASLENQIEKQKRSGQNFLKNNGYQLISYGVAGLTGSLGLGFLLGTAVNPLFGFGFAGIGLMASSLGLLNALSTRNRGAITNLNPDSVLIKYLLDNRRQPTVITSFSSQVLGMNRAFSALKSSRRYPLSDLLAVEGGEQVIDSLLKRVYEETHLVEMMASSTPDLGDVRIEVTRVGDYAVWTFDHQAENIRLQTAVKRLEERTVALTMQMEVGLAVVNLQGRVLYANDLLRAWYKLGPTSPLPSRLRLRENKTRLVVDKETVLHVMISEVPIPVKDKEKPFAKLLFIYNKPGYVVPYLAKGDGAKLIDTTWDTAPTGIAVVDAKGSIEEKNIWFNQFSKYITGNNIVSMFKRESQAELKRHIASAAAGKVVQRPLDVIYQGTSAKAGAQVGQVYFSTIVHEEKQYALLYMLDQTLQKSLEQQFVQGQKMQAIGQLAGGVAHDFNNLLTAIIGFSDLLSARLDVSDDAFNDVMNIKQNANRAAVLVRQLLAFSRQQTLRPTVLMVSDVLTDVSNLLRRLLGEKIELNLIYGRDLKPTKVDQGQLEQVLINLVVNARDAMAGVGTLNITVRMVQANDPELDIHEVIIPDDYILVEVEDSGVGIDAETLPKIFEPFFTTKDVGKGTGLGLATVYGIVKQTGGYVFASSEPGKGAVFKVFLSAHKPEEGEELEAKVEERTTGDLTGDALILLVEDDDAVRLFAARALTNKGYRVVEASSGEEGLALFKKHGDKIDLLITDVIMPNIDGPTLVRAAKNDRPTLPVIFISGYAEDVVRKDLEDRDSYFLPKPFNLQELAKMVKSIV